jgi:hypothetical protein
VGSPAAAPRIDQSGDLTYGSAAPSPIKSPTITNPVEIPDPRLELDGFDIEASDSIDLNYRRSALGHGRRFAQRTQASAPPQ